MSHARVLIALIACAGLIAAQNPKKPDPSQGEVILPAPPGWNASLIYEGDVGIWTCGSFKCFPGFGCPEVYGLDDKGRFTVFVSYSGKWTPYQTIEDREWLGAVNFLDLDPRVSGEEIYTGGKRGNVYQIVAHAEGGFDTSVIARFPGQEVHTFAGGDLLPSRKGHELIGFTLLGDVFAVVPKPGPGTGFETPHLARVSGRVRDAVVLPAAKGEAPWVAGACRSGEVLLMRLTENGIDQRVALKEPMGLGRIARRKDAAGGREVLYVTRDDGVVLRLEEQPDGAFSREVIYAGPQGPRGIAAGRFGPTPDVETVAVFGYSSKIQVLTRSKDGKWTAETIFEDRDKGHWLAAAELDGRNGTDEIIGSGYGSRVVLLSRPPGYGLPNVAVEPLPGRSPEPKPDTRPADIRMAVSGSTTAVKSLTPLAYRGGFETKTAIFETLVRRDAEGRLAPGLAASWSTNDGGRTWSFILRENAVFHDGRTVDAEAVRLHFKRWVGLPEHDWLRTSRHARDVRAASPRELVIELDRPYAVPEEMTAINPASIMAPGSIDREGSFVRPIGSGPFRSLGLSEDGRTMRLEATPVGAGSAPFRLDLVLFDPMTKETPVQALLAGRVDAVTGGWSDLLKPADLAALASDPRFETMEVPGSSVWCLVIEAKSAQLSNRGARRQVARALDREALVREVEDGHARASTRIFSAPCWPHAVAAPESAPMAWAGGPLRILATGSDDREAALANAIVAQLSRASIPAAVVKDPAGEHDLRFWHSWGVPYDPFVSLTSSFRPKGPPSAVGGRPVVENPQLTALIERLEVEPDEVRRLGICAEIQRFVSDEALIFPLLVPNHVAVRRRDAPHVAIDHDLYRFAISRTRKEAR
jgi:ABC-type transport system substrate-binding protein